MAKKKTTKKKSTKKKKRSRKQILEEIEELEQLELSKELAEEEKGILMIQEKKVGQSIKAYKDSEAHFAYLQDVQLKTINRHLRRVSKPETTHALLKQMTVDIRGKQIPKIIKEPIITAEEEGVAPAPKPDSPNTEIDEDEE